VKLKRSRTFVVVLGGIWVQLRYLGPWSRWAGSYHGL